MVTPVITKLKEVSATYSLEAGPQILSVQSHSG
jgi:hypothetical protein